MKAQVSIATLLAVPLALIVCCIHFGASEFASTQFALFVVSGLLAAPALLRNAVKPTLLGALLLIVVVMGWYFGGHDELVVLKGFRSIIVILLLLAWRSIALGSPSVMYQTVVKAIWIAAIASLLLGACQLVDSLTVNSGLFDIPKDIFALEYGTSLAERRDALSAVGYVIRPSGFFSEPSALAALGVLSVAVSFLVRDSRLRAVGFAIVVVSQSMSGLLFAMIVALFGASSEERKNTLIVFLPLLLLGFLYLAGTGRLEEVFLGNDISTRVRIAEPMGVLNRMVQEQLFLGASPETLLRYASVDIATIYDNWALNQLLLYGVLGIVWLVIPLAVLPKVLWPLFGALMMTNGDVLYYDRYLLLLLAVVIATCGKNKS